jgi:hypothetical protein
MKMLLRVTAVVLLGLTSLLAEPKIPRPLPDLAMRSPLNAPIKFSKYRGKALLIAIVSTECESCGADVAILNKIQKDMGPQGVQVVAAAVNMSAPNSVNQFIARFRPTFPVGFMDEATARKLMDMGNTTDRPYVPIFIFVDKKGIVALQQNGDSPFFQKIDGATRAMLNNLLKR